MSLVEKKSAKVNKVDISQISELFLGISKRDLGYPEEKMNFLIAATYCELLPRVFKLRK